MAESIVSLTVSPGLDGLVSVTSMGWPRASETMRRSPSWPRRAVFKPYSRPESPLPSVPTVPSSCEASHERGYVRRWRGMSWMPGMSSFLTLSASGPGTIRAR